MRWSWQNLVAAAAVALAGTTHAAATAAVEPSATGAPCAQAAASKPAGAEPRRPTRTLAGAPACGEVVTSVALTLAAPQAVAAPASAVPAAPAASKAKDGARNQPSPSALRLIEQGAVAAAVVSSLLLLAGLLVGAWRGGFGLAGHAGSFGGRGWSWEATPALTLLVCAAVVMALSLLLVWQVLQFDAPGPAQGAAQPSTKQA